MKSSRWAGGSPARWEGVLAPAVLLAWLYLVFLGGTWAVISSFEVRLISTGLLITTLAFWLVPAARGHGTLPATGMDRPIVVFVAVAALATAFALNVRLSLEAFVLLGGYVLLYYLLAALAFEHPRALIGALLAGAAVLAVAAIAESLLRYFGLAPWAGSGVSWPSIALPGQWLPPVWPRPSLVAGNPNVLAGLIAPLAPLAIAIAISTRSKVDRAAASLAVALIVMALIAAGSRGGFLALAAGLAGFPVLLSLEWHRERLVRVFRSWWRRSAIAIASLLTVSAVFALILPPIITTDGTAGVRAQLWDGALRMALARPLLGFGPDSFGLALLALRSPTASGADLLPHPHNLYLGLAAETGLLGLGAAIGLGLAVARTWWRGTLTVRRIGARGPLGQQTIVLSTGLLAGLLAMAAHGLVEDFRITPAIVVEGIAIVALITARHSEHVLTPAGLRVRTLLVPALAMLAVTAYSTYGRWELSLGASLADAGRWAEGQIHLDAAAAWDPAIALYSFQASLAQGWTAGSGDAATASQNRTRAVDGYGHALAQEDEYALNHANLAVLLWDEGDRERATAEMARAVALRPLETRFRLLLASYYHAVGQRDAAERAYRAALVTQPEILDSLVWQEIDGVDKDALVAAARDDLEERAPLARAQTRGALALYGGYHAEAKRQFEVVAAVAPTSPEAWWGLGMAALMAEETGEAVSTLSRASLLQPANAEYRATLAMALAKQGDDVGAEREARTALFITPNRNASLVLARLARSQGRTSEAIARYRSALGAPATYLAYGLAVWRRAAIRHDSLPQIRSVLPSRRDADIYAEFASYMRAIGRIDEEGRVDRAWADYRAGAG